MGFMWTSNDSFLYFIKLLVSETRQRVFTS